MLRLRSARQRFKHRAPSFAAEHGGHAHSACATGRGQPAGFVIGSVSDCIEAVGDRAGGIVCFHLNRSRSELPS